MSFSHLGAQFSFSKLIVIYDLSKCVSEEKRYSVCFVIEIDSHGFAANFERSKVKIQHEQRWALLMSTSLILKLSST